MLRTPEDLAYVRVSAAGLAPDGTSVRDADVFQSFRRGRACRSEDELGREMTEVRRAKRHRAERGSGGRSLRRPGAV